MFAPESERAAARRAIVRAQAAVGRFVRAAESARATGPRPVFRNPAAGGSLRAQAASDGTRARAWAAAFRPAPGRWPVAEQRRLKSCVCIICTTSARCTIAHSTSESCSERRKRRLSIRAQRDDRRDNNERNADQTGPGRAIPAHSRQRLIGEAHAHQEAAEHDQRDLTPATAARRNSARRPAQPCGRRGEFWPSAARYLTASSYGSSASEAE